MNCDKCMHSTVCIYEAGAREFESKLEGVIKDAPAMISVNVSCEKFRFKFDKSKIKDAKVNKKITKKISPKEIKNDSNVKADDK